MNRSNHPGHSASATARSRTPSSKFARLALTVPTATLLPSTNERLIASAGTSVERLPPVTLDSTRTPSLPRTCMASKTSGEKPVASKMRSMGPASATAAVSVVVFVLTYRAPTASTMSLLRYGGSSIPNVSTSRPRRRRKSVASSPSGPAPSTAARRGPQTFSLRWISYACAMPFSTTLAGSSSTPWSARPPGTRTRYSGVSTYISVRKPCSRLMPCSKYTVSVVKTARPI